MTNSFMPLKHPTSGDVYACEVAPDGTVLKASGPLHHSDSRDSASLIAWIENDADAEETALWLQTEFEHNPS